MSAASTSTNSVSPLQTALLQSNQRSGERYGLRTAVVRIGRGVLDPQDIQLPPDDVRASREHARLVFEEGSWFVEDLSRNGTIVNGQTLRRGRAKLASGDRIKIGESFDVTFRYLSDTTQTDDAPETTPRYNTGTTESPATQVGLWISPSAAVWRDGERLPVFLSRTEYRLLKHLIQHAGDVCEYESVINAVWGETRDKDSLHELIYRVRRKIEPSPSQPRYLVIRSGIGVVLFPQGVRPAPG
jgi:pSer/pThr/pTyr-binding forkhead associated (FHA) protein